MVRRVAGFVAYLLATVATVAAVAESCTPFEEEGARPDTTPDAAEDAAPFVPSDSSLAADSGDSGLGALRATCPVSRAPSCEIFNCPEVVVYAPAMRRLARGLATDASHIYWLEAENGGETTPARVLRARKGVANGAAAEVLATGQIDATTLVLDGDYVYWTSRPPVDGGGVRATINRVRRACAASGCGEPVAVAELGNTDIQFLGRPAPGVLFFVSAFDGRARRYAVTSAGLTATPPIDMAKFYPSTVVTDQHLYASSTMAGSVVQLAVNGVDLNTSYFPAEGGGRTGFEALGTDCVDLIGNRDEPPQVGGGGKKTLERLTTSTMEPTVLASMTFNVRQIVADGANIYFNSKDLPSGLWMVSATTADGGAPRQVIASEVTAIAVDDDGLYWSDGSSSSGGRIHMRLK